MKKKPRAAVFDCDGLLLDTEDCWTLGEKELFAAYGLEFTPEHKRRLLGTSSEAAGRVLAELLDRPGEEERLAAERLERCWEKVVRGARPRPGAAELLERLRGRIPVGLASNSPRALVLEALETAGIDGFDVIVGGDEVRKPKPAAEIYTTACERLGISPRDSVALEDSPVGVAAARAAGLYVIGVPSQPGIALDADMVADSLRHPKVWSRLGAGG